MPVPHHTKTALATVVALVNTSHGGREGLPEAAALDRFLRDYGWTVPGQNGRQELDRVRRLRRQLADLWETNVDEAAAHVNSLLSRARALPQLVKDSDRSYYMRAIPMAASLADRITVEAAMAFGDVIQSGQFSRLRKCATDDCHNVFVDYSKNRSRRFCSATCMNRVNMAAFRSRRALGGSEQDS